MKNSEICGFHSRFHTCSICILPETANVNLVCAFACPLLLWPERVVAYRVSLTIFFGFVRFFYKHARPSLLIFFVEQILFSYTNNLIFYFLCHVQICIAFGDCFENSLTDACCTVSFDCDRAYSNKQNAFSLPVNGISISVNIKTSNFSLFKNMLSK